MAPLRLTVVGGLSAELLCAVEAEEDGTISCAKAAIEGTLGTPMRSQRLVATRSGRLLADDERLRDVADSEGTDVILVRADPQWCRLLSDLESGRVELEDVDAAWRHDREVVLAAVRTDGCALEWAGDDLRSDREVVLAAVCESGSALRHAGEDLQDDREVVLTAVQGFGLALEHASPSLRRDPEVALAAVRRDLAALAHAGEELKKNRDFALAVVHGDGAALRHLPEEMKRDGDVVLAAIRDHPSALLWAALELQADRDFVLSAVQINGVSLRYATQEMKRDARVVLAAMSQNTQALWYGSPELKSDKRFTQAVQRLLHMGQEQEDPIRCQMREALLQELLAELDTEPALTENVAGSACAEASLLGAEDARDRAKSANFRHPLGPAPQWPHVFGTGGSSSSTSGCGATSRPAAQPQDTFEVVGATNDSVDGIVDRLRGAPGVRNLAILKCEGISSGNWVRIFAMVPRTVEVINVQRSSLGDAGAEELGALLGCGCFPELTTIWLLSNEVCDPGSAALAAGFGAQQCPRLREVWIHDNLSDASKALISASLPGIEVEFDDLGLSDEEEEEEADGSEGADAD